MKNKSKITGIRQQAQKSVDKAESSINRFASFMGVLSKGITKDIPDKKTIKKARLFAKNFGGGRSSKVEIYRGTSPNPIWWKRESNAIRS